MSAKVRFKINPETSNLDIFIEELDSTEIEIKFAKKVLSLATQLHFVDLPESNGIDIGASIVIEEELYDDDYDYEEDEDEYEEDNDLDISIKEEFLEVEMEVDDSVENEMPELDSISYVNDESEINYDEHFNLIKEQINKYREENDTLTWAEADTYVSIKADFSEASELVGGLTTPSSIATMMIYELLKRTLSKVEKYS